MNNKIDVLAIVGPTASGKTALSVELAKQLNGEVINGDSTQVYKGFNIGTAKITEAEKDGVVHHLFDIKEPTENFSVAEYQIAVRTCIEEIQSRGKLPIIVGGTGLYVQAVLYDFRFTEEVADLAIRARLERELEDKGSDHLYAQLVKADALGAEKIHPNNHRRVIRALEIIEITGKSKGQHEQNQGNEALYHHLIFGLEMERPVLYDRINKRTDMMMAQGFLAEVNELLQAGFKDTPAMKAIGYRELQQYVEGILTYEEAIEAIQKGTRNYAKRQMTYFKNKLDIQWLDAQLGTAENLKKILQIMKDF